jgi:hypothetical protein
MVTILIGHSDGPDARRPGRSVVAEDQALADRLSRFHRRHHRQEVLHWLTVIPIILIVAWAVIAGALSLLVQ